jgi:hypothetical protein
VVAAAFYEVLSLSAGHVGGINSQFKMATAAQANI